MSIIENSLENRETKLNKDIKRCNVYSVVSGSVATLSSLILAGNLIIGNGLEALQVGGSTVAMVAYLIGYSQMSQIYKNELDNLKNNTPKDKMKERLEQLKSQLEIYKTSLTMDYIVTGGFYTSALANIMELLTKPELSGFITSTIGAALSAIVATSYLYLIKINKESLKRTKRQKEVAESIIELEKIELLDKKDTIKLDVPQQQKQDNIVELEQYRRLYK